MMQKPIEIAKNIYWVGVNDWETGLFEAIWPLPRGICYNSYLIVDEKVALIDTVKKTGLPQLIDKIRHVIEEGRKVDYLIVNHMEPDHSGSMKVINSLFPGITIVGNRKTIDFARGFYRVADNVHVVEDGDTLELGRHTLKFFMTPMVHWPETMMTWEPGNRVLFSGDAFGGFGTLNGGIFDDEVNLDFFENEILRYFSNIVAKFSPSVQKAIKRLDGLDIKIIASTHGPVFRSRPGYILDLYDKWSRQETERGVVIVYASMYGNTQIMAEAVARAVATEGIDHVILHNISKTHLSFVLTDIWRYGGLVLGACTYNATLFPLMQMLVHTLKNDKLRGRILGLFGSYSWSGGAVKELTQYAEGSPNTLAGPVVESRWAPTDEILDACVALGRNVARAL